MKKILVVLVVVVVALSALAGGETNLLNVTTNVASGTNLVAVTWTNVFAAPPNLVLAGVRSPADTGVGSYRLFATAIASTLATNGVTVELSGITDTTGYVVTVSVWE